MLEVRASVLMELIVDKLTLLDYENKFCNSRKPPWPRLHKFYFAMPCNTRNDQFLYFISLASWLLSLIGRKFSAPKEHMDPNATCTDIMHHLKELGFAQPSWAASKLKQGFGDAVCSVLDSLTDLALQTQRFQFNQPVYNREASFDEHVEIVNTNDDSAEEVCVLPDAIRMKSEEKNESTSGSLLINLDKQAAVRDYFEESKIEAERVAFQLRVAMEMSESLSSCCSQLQRIEEDISFFFREVGEPREVPKQAV